MVSIMASNLIATCWSSINNINLHAVTVKIVEISTEWLTQLCRLGWFGPYTLSIDLGIAILAGIIFVVTTDYQKGS